MPTKEAHQSRIADDALLSVVARMERSVIRVSVPRYTEIPKPYLTGKTAVSVRFRAMSVPDYAAVRLHPGYAGLLTAFYRSVGKGLFACPPFAGIESHF